MKCANEPCASTFPAPATDGGTPHCPTCKSIFFFRDDGTLAGPSLSTNICQVCGSTFNVDPKLIFVDRKPMSELHECKGGPYKGPRIQVGGPPPGMPVIHDPVPVPEDASINCRRPTREVQGKKPPPCAGNLGRYRDMVKALPPGKLTIGACPECGLTHGFTRKADTNELMYGAVI